MNPEEFYVNSFLCSKCHGRCCQTSGCFFMPEDFDDLSCIEEVIRKNTWIVIAKIKPYGREEDVLYLKVRNKESGQIEKPGTKGPCILLSKTGCPLDFQHRPSGGRLLIPDDDSCYYDFPLRNVYEAWAPYQQELKSLWEKLEEEEGY